MKMKIKTKTRLQLHKEGFQSNKDGLYLGEVKSKPDLQITNYQAQFMLGKEYDLSKITWNTKDEPVFRTLCGQKVPWYLIEGQLPDKSNFKSLIIEKKFQKGTVEICTATKLVTFPCSMSVVSLKELKEVYEWVSKSVLKLAAKKKD
jgi:hypothetical protein